VPDVLSSTLAFDECEDVNLVVNILKLEDIETEICLESLEFDVSTLHVEMTAETVQLAFVVFSSS
jgi:hypothetical protein